MFKAVFIPCSEDPIVEESYSTEGGLDCDALRIAAGKYFTTPINKMSVAALDLQKQEIESLLKERGSDVSTAKTQSLIKTIQNQGSAGGVEIVVLSLPTLANGKIGVSLYSGRNGQANNMPVNRRATSLANFCEHKVAIYGDVFVGRYHDDEDCEWKRLDFCVSDLSSDAEWVLQTQKMNRGKNMGSLSTSGQLQNILNQGKQTEAARLIAGQIESPSSSAGPSVESPVMSNCSWTQDDDNVELLIKLADGVKRCDIDLVIRSSSLQIKVSPATDAADLLRERAQISELDRHLWLSGEPQDLFDAVDFSCSTWTMETTKKEGLQLHCTLAKKKEGLHWLDLLRK